MSRATLGPDDRADYEVRIKGHLGARWSTWFEGLTLTQESDGTTVIHGLAMDQAALHGLLRKVRDTGLPLVSATRSAPVGSQGRTSEPMIGQRRRRASSPDQPVTTRGAALTAPPNNEGVTP